MRGIRLAIRRGWLTGVALAVSVGAQAASDAQSLPPARIEARTPVVFDTFERFCQEAHWDDAAREIDRVITAPDSDQLVGPIVVDALASARADAAGSEVVPSMGQWTESAATTAWYVPTGWEAQRRLIARGTQNADLLAAYRRLVDDRAGELWSQSTADPAASAAQQILDRYFASSFGARAIALVGSRHFQRGELAQARQVWSRVDRRVMRLAHGDRSGAAVDGLCFPDASADLIADIAGRVVLVSAAEGDTARATSELATLTAQWPDASAVVGGRRTKWSEALARRLAEQEASARDRDSAPEWPTFGGNVERNRIASGFGQLDGPPVWSVPVAPGPRRTNAFATRRTPVGEGLNSRLASYPVVSGGAVWWAESNRIRALRLADGAPVFLAGPELDRDPSAKGTIWSALNRSIERDEERSVYGSPSWSLDVHEAWLFARTGEGEVTSPSAGRERGELIGLDLSQEGKLLPGFPIEPPGIEWSFAGPPVYHGGQLLVLLRKVLPNRRATDIFVASYELVADEAAGPLGVRWLTQLCQSESIAGDGVEIACDAISVSGGLVVCNTNSGTIAAVDLASGRLAWIVTYPRLGMPTDAAQERVTSGLNVFRDMNPPLCDRGIAFVAPRDSPSIIAIELATGQVEWTASQADVKHLLGRIDDVLVASGDRLVWIDARTGHQLSSWPQGAPEQSRSARPAVRGWGRGVIADRTIVFPTANRLWLFDIQLDAIRGADQRQWLVPRPTGVIELGPHGFAGGQVIVIGDRMILMTADRLGVFPLNRP